MDEGCDCKSSRECVFIGEVDEELICKLCNHVAQDLCLISCCSEPFCELCLKRTKETCVCCGRDQFTAFPHHKNRQKILKLQVKCTMCNFGCDWIGSLADLDAHLEPKSGSCNYVPVQCPDCSISVPKTELLSHSANNCCQRSYTCSYCNFKATYKIVSEEHWPACSYYPLQCPNRCGVSCERETMDYHLTVCSLQEVDCDCSRVGCKEKFLKKAKEAHDVQNSQKHLALVAKAVADLSQNFHEVDSSKEAHLKQLEAEVATQKEAIKVKDEQITELLKRVLTMEGRFQRELNQVRIQGSIVPYDLVFSNISSKKTTFASIDSQPLYTSPMGYGFHIILYPYGDGCGDRLSLSLGVIPEAGEFDSSLKWPANFRVVIELRNQHADLGHCVKTIECGWRKTRNGAVTGHGFEWEFIKISDLGWNPNNQTCFLKEDSLCFRITSVHLCKVV